MSKVSNNNGGFCDWHWQLTQYNDTKLSSSATLEDFGLAVENVQSCVDDVMSWMSSNKLKLNPDKTEVMVVGSRYSPLESFGMTSVNIGGSSVNFQKKCRYLGVVLDNKLTLDAFIGSTCSSCRYDIRRIACIRKYLTQSAAAKLMSALVISRLDYCNALLASASQDQINRLQMIQNHAARVVMRKRIRDHITPVLHELHWLPIEYRYKFKIATLAYRQFQGSLPSYLGLNSRECSRDVRSNSEKRLHPPKNRTSKPLEDVLLNKLRQRFGIHCQTTWSQSTLFPFSKGSSRPISSGNILDKFSDSSFFQVRVDYVDYGCSPLFVDIVWLDASFWIAWWWCCMSCAMSFHFWSDFARYKSYL